LTSKEDFGVWSETFGSYPNPYAVIARVSPCCLKPFTAATTGGNFSVVTSAVSNQIRLGDSRQIQFY
jgi:hypothetical protein